MANKNMEEATLEENHQREIAYEVLQDLFTMYMCFNIQSKIKNPFIQELYGYIMVFFYSVFLHELYKANLIDENQYTKIPKSLMNEFRQRFLKKKAEVGKTHLDSIRKEMGIDFDHFMYDIILTVDAKDRSKLYSVNLGLWDLERVEKEKLELFNSLVRFPEKLIKELFREMADQEVADDLIKIFDTACEAHAAKLDSKMSPVKYPYASAVFFKNPELEEQDKYTVMYYYSYFSLFGMLDEFVPALKVEGEVININVSYSVMKLKAMLIGTFGDAIFELKTRIVRSIKKEIEDSFGESDVFKLNRRLRNNLHYNSVDKLSDTELERIDIFQRKYMEIVLNTFKENIKFKIGKWYQLVKWIADHTDEKILEEKNDR